VSNLVGVVEDWRRHITEVNRQDGTPDPTDEEVLGVFLHAAIFDLLEHSTKNVVEYLRSSDGRDFDFWLVEWIEHYKPS
jgi:hypothetical protein